MSMPPKYPALYDTSYSPKRYCDTIKRFKDENKRKCQDIRARNSKRQRQNLPVSPRSQRRQEYVCGQYEGYVDYRREFCEDGVHKRRRSEKNHIKVIAMRKRLARLMYEKSYDQLNKKQKALVDERAHSTLGVPVTLD